MRSAGTRASVAAGGVGAGRAGAEISRPVSSPVFVREVGPGHDVVPGVDAVRAASPRVASPYLHVDVRSRGAAALPDAVKVRGLPRDPLAPVHVLGAHVV